MNRLGQAVLFLSLTACLGASVDNDGGAAGGASGGRSVGGGTSSAGGSAVGGGTAGSSGGRAGGDAGGDAGGSAGGDAGGSAGGDAGGSAGGAAGGDAAGGGSSGGSSSTGGGAACTPADPCTTNPNACRQGRVLCSSGAPVCTDGPPVANGTFCGTDQVCSGGTCVACADGQSCNTNSNRCKLGVTSCASGSVTCSDGANNVTAGTPCGSNVVCDGSGACVACTAGGSCSTNPNPCKVGRIDCGGGSPSCVDTAADVANGTPCGSGQTCSGGNCGSCMAGGACGTNPNQCRVGVVSCSTGAPVCTNSGSNVDAGTSCGTSQVCSGGGTCVTCDGGASCTGNANPCRFGVVGCSTGTSVCTNSSTRFRDAGTTCGTNFVCNVGGTCVACTAGGACTTNPNECKLGVISCASGASTCIDGTGNAAAGTSCGSGQSCDGSGNCVVPPGLPAIAIATGRSHTCAVASNNTVWCWGGNDYGQLGNGMMNSTLVLAPRQVAGITTAVAVTSYSDHTCVRTSAGAVRCWGYNAHSELGTGAPNNATSPVTPPGMGANVRDVAAGKVHTCAIRTDGGVFCWGQNNGGNLGNGTNGDDEPTPAQVSGVVNGVGISAGDNSTCAVQANGVVRCWGTNPSGQIGTTVSDTSVPVVVTGVAGARDVSIGADHACASGDAGVWCWGDNSNGQLGNGSSGASNVAPALISGLAGASGISVGFDSSCMRSAAGAVRCFGWNVGTFPEVNTPTVTTKAGLNANVSAFSVGAAHACAIRDGGVRCWGSNEFGQLGDGTTTNSNAIVTVPGFQ